MTLAKHWQFPWYYMYLQAPCSCHPNLQFLSHICFSFMTFNQSTVRMLVFSSVIPQFKILTISCSFKSGVGRAISLSEWDLCLSITAATAGKSAFAAVKLVHTLGKENLFLIKMEPKQFRQLERLLKTGKIGFPGFGQWSRENLSLWKANRRTASGQV